MPHIISPCDSPIELVYTAYSNSIRETYEEMANGVDFSMRFAENCLEMLGNERFKQDLIALQR